MKEEITSSAPGPWKEQGEQEGGLWLLGFNFECFPISVSASGTPLE